MKVKRNANGYTLNVSVQEADRVRNALAAVSSCVNEEGILYGENTDYTFSSETLKGIRELVKVLKENI